jgi:large subunit ribosomal protein L15
MSKLNEIAPQEGSTKNRMRVGRGPGSGKGKTAGRGVKGQKARSGVAIHGFEGGQMPLHMRMPKRGFNNPFAKEFAVVNFWRLEQAIAAGKLDAGKLIDADALVAAGVVRRAKDGVKLLGEGELSSKIEIAVYAASASALAAVEKAGGSVTITKPAPRPAGKLVAKVKA